MLASNFSNQRSGQVAYAVAGATVGTYADEQCRSGLAVLQVKTHYETLENNNAKRKRLVRFPYGFSVSFHQCGGFQTW